MLKRALTAFLVAGRWVQAPLYVGLVLVVATLCIKFFEELIYIVPVILVLTERELLLTALRLVDLVLVASLLLIVTVWGYRKFVSSIEESTKDTPLGWVTRLPAGSLRVEIAATLASISAIRLLEAFLDVEDLPNDKLMWLVVIQLVFVVSAVLIAWLDKIAPLDTD